MLLIVAHDVTRGRSTHEAYGDPKTQLIPGANKFSAVCKIACRSRVEKAAPRLEHQALRISGWGRWCKIPME